MPRRNRSRQLTPRLITNDMALIKKMSELRAHHAVAQRTGQSKEARRLLKEIRTLQTKANK